MARPPVPSPTASQCRYRHIQHVPSSHSGSGEFTFDLTFSENFPLSYKTLRDHAFTKDAQNEDHVVAAQRKVPGSNQTWTITVKPPGNSTMTITAARDHRLHRLRRDLHRRRPQAFECKLGLDLWTKLASQVHQAQRAVRQAPSPPYLSPHQPFSPTATFSCADPPAHTPGPPVPRALTQYRHVT